MNTRFESFRRPFGILITLVCVFVLGSCANRPPHDYTLDSGESNPNSPRTIFKGTWYADFGDTLRFDGDGNYDYSSSPEAFAPLTESGTFTLREGDLHLTGTRTSADDSVASVDYVCQYEIITTRKVEIICPKLGVLRRAYLVKQP